MYHKKSEVEKENNSTFHVVLGLIGMVKPLLGIMLLAIAIGVIGNLMAIFITVLGGAGVGIILKQDLSVSFTPVFVAIVFFAIFRGILRYVEQASNHYIAFKILARIRHQVFDSLRKLAPAKLDMKEKGNLISIITSDIELLEVFFAHTISPVGIALMTSLIMSLFIGHFNFALGILAFVFYIIVGTVIPILNSRKGQKYGQEYRSNYGKLNTTILDNLYGLDEILQYGRQKERQDKMETFTKELERVNYILKNKEIKQKISTDTVILAAGILMVICSGMLTTAGTISTQEAILCTIAMMSSFGPVAALSALSNDLNKTFASGNRVLNLLNETPIVEEINSNIGFTEGDICVENITFSYIEEKEKKRQEILKDFSLHINKNKIHGILGKSGCGKSTLLKLLMRFYETSEGKICYGDRNVSEIDTSELRKGISYVTQETFLFQDTIENNMKVAKADATREEVIKAAKKAAIHDFIISLPLGYDTKLSELGDCVSGGERQRIGIARAFLHNAKVILLDEPTSNIDSLNESMILINLYQEKKDKTIVLVSHRKSTMAIADEITNM